MNQGTRRESFLLSTMSAPAMCSLMVEESPGYGAYPRGPKNERRGLWGGPVRSFLNFERTGMGVVRVALSLCLASRHP